MLAKVKIRLGLTNNTDKDDLIGLTIQQATDSILLYISEEEIPAKLKSVTEEVACAIFRRVGAEGISSEQVDTVNQTYANNALSNYYEILDKYITNRDKIASRKVKFY